MSGKNGEKVENITGAELVREKMHTQNPGIPEVKKVTIGSPCTLALPVRFPHQTDKEGVCDFCKTQIDSEKPREACPERAPIVGHFHKLYKLAAIRDGGDTLILKKLG